MYLHLLLTSDILSTKPNTTKIIEDFGILSVIFEHTILTGKHCIVRDTEINIINWLKPFNGFAKGNGNPIEESFNIVHIK